MEAYNLEAKNVMSLYQELEFPKNTDLVLKNNRNSELKENVDKIIELID
tara:strand:- start:353 stop:499 length:147 start_codon:yes stop_codon:yes gene_type:complete